MENSKYKGPKAGMRNNVCETGKLFWMEHGERDGEERRG